MLGRKNGYSAATTQERDLGIVFTDNLGLSTQCAEAAKRVSMIRRQFKERDKECFMILYKSFVRLHMEFAIQVWSPYLKGPVSRNIFIASFQRQLHK